MRVIVEMIGGVEMTAKSRLGRVLLGAIPVAALAALFAFGPISQPPDYHQFADQRGSRQRPVQPVAMIIGTL